MVPFSGSSQRGGLPFLNQEKTTTTPIVAKMREEVVQDLYDSLQFDKETRRWLAKEYVAGKTDDEVEQMWIDAELDRSIG